tara:strand:+ start:168 stop:632 length:465 start_codon:yes stop_codon:yes gene_type:complete
MTNNWLNTKAGQRFANHTIPDLTAAINRVGDLLENQTNDLKSKETPRPLRDYFMEKDREYLEKEITRVMSWEPTELEILLYRALSRAYCAPRGVMEEGDDTFDEAYHALAIASHDFRNALTCHTFVVEDEIADDNPQRIDWEYCSILNAADALD